MDDMQSKLNAILGNPQMMQQIMSMAQAMGQEQPEPPNQAATPPPPPPPENSAVPAFSLPDAATMQRIAGLAGQTGIDKNQQALLKALRPYLSRERVNKLERAMRAAKIAGVAATALGGSGLSFLTGR